MFSSLPYPIAIDERLNCGPLMGILSGLKASSNKINFVIACDIPEINFQFLETLRLYCKNHDIVVPQSGETKYEPLFAFYNKRLVPIIEDLLNQDIKRISQLFLKCSIKYVPFENNSW